MGDVVSALLKPRRTVGDAVEHDVEFHDSDGEVVTLGAGGVTNVVGEAPEVDLTGLVSADRTVNGKSLNDDVVLTASDIQVDGSENSVAAAFAELKAQIQALEERILELETAN